ncbi:small GTPase superfamily [Pelomyxa schiedti]|nr:small GTPase superfamily [Pelomyxa schiedti]
MSSGMRIGRVAVLGAHGVGKTALVETYINGFFSDREYEGSLEPSYRRQLDIDGTAAIIELLDSPGTEQFTAMRDCYYKSSHVVLLCFSLVDTPSFDTIMTEFFPSLRAVSPKTVTFLVGLKMDLLTESNQEAAFQRGITAAIKTESYGYFQCSSKMKLGLDHLFEHVCRAGLTSVPVTKPKKFGFFNFSFFSSSTGKGNEARTISNTTKMIASDTSESSLATIPVDILRGILEYLDFVSLVRISRTCHQLYHMAKTEPLWTNALKSAWIFPGVTSALPFGFLRHQAEDGGGLTLMRLCVSVHTPPFCWQTTRNALCKTSKWVIPLHLQLVTALTAVKSKSPPLPLCVAFGSAQLWDQHPSSP